MIKKYALIYSSEEPTYRNGLFDDETTSIREMYRLFVVYMYLGLKAFVHKTYIFCPSLHIRMTDRRQKRNIDVDDMLKVVDYF